MLVCLCGVKKGALNAKSVQEVSKQILADWNLTSDSPWSRQSDSNRRPADSKCQEGLEGSVLTIDTQEVAGSNPASRTISLGSSLERETLSHKSKRGERSNFGPELYW